MKNEIRQKEEVARLRVIVKDSIYPLVLSSSENIEDAKVFVSALSMAIKQAFNNRMTQVKVSELNLSDYLIDGDKAERYKALLEIVKDESITSSSMLLDGLPQAIDMAIREENQKRSLKDIKVDLF